MPGLLPLPAALGLAYALSEIALSLWRRPRRRALGHEISRDLLWWAMLGGISAGAAASFLLPGARFALTDEPYAAACLLCTAGLALRWYAVFSLGRFYTQDVTVAPDHRLIETGPYRYIRHPAYAGALLALLGLAIAMANTVSIGLVMLPLTAGFLYRIRIEESALRDAFGVRYLTYMRRTKKLIPLVF